MATPLKVWSLIGLLNPILLVQKLNELSKQGFNEIKADALPHCNSLVFLMISYSNLIYKDLPMPAFRWFFATYRQKISPTSDESRSRFDTVIVPKMKPTSGIKKI